MIVALALVPSAPVLLRELTGSADPVPELRRACGLALVRALAPGPDVVHVVAADGPAVTPSSFAPTAPNPPRDPPRLRDHGSSARPLGHLVGDRLLAAAQWSGDVAEHAVDVGQGAGALAALGRRLAHDARKSALLVVGDGSARRGVRAPGYVDPRAEPFDADVLDAVAHADPEALAALDPALARELLSDGWAPWQVLAGVLDVAPLAAEVLFADDPFGVFYVVASLSTRQRADLP